MGKWEAQETTEKGEYNVYKETDGGLISIGNLDQDEVQILDKDLATRYAVALNIVDAGVGFSDALRLVHEWDEAKTTEEEMFVAVNMAMCLRSIANAVEGDTTKEDV